MYLIIIFIYFFADRKYKFIIYHYRYLSLSLWLELNYKGRIKNIIDETIDICIRSGQSNVDAKC